MNRSPRQASSGPDCYDSDYGRPPNTPPLRQRHVRLQPSPSPQPLPIGQNRLSPIRLPSMTRRKRPKQKNKPSLGDVMLVSAMDEGKHPDLARTAGKEPLASDDDDTDQSSVRGTQLEDRADILGEDNGVDLTALAADALRAHEGCASGKPLQTEAAAADALILNVSMTPNGSVVGRLSSRQEDRDPEHAGSVSYIDVHNRRMTDGPMRSESASTPAGDLAPLHSQPSLPGVPVGSDAGSIRLPSISHQLVALGHIDAAGTARREPSSIKTTQPNSLRQPRYAPHTSRPSSATSPSNSTTNFPIPSPIQASERYYNDQDPQRNGFPPDGYQYPTAKGDYNSSSSTDAIAPDQSNVTSTPAPVINRMSIDGITNPQVGSFKCTFPGCVAPAFLTQYLLNSHANVHSSNRPHYCSVQGCARAEGGKGFKRKNEMIRHGLVHVSPGYICPFCPDREHKYPRPDNLQRHVRVHHTDRDKDDPSLREVLSQRPEGPSKGRRRRGGPS